MYGACRKQKGCQEIKQRVRGMAACGAGAEDGTGFVYPDRKSIRQYGIIYKKWH
jgi:hypothetical protein